MGNKLNSAIMVGVAALITLVVVFNVYSELVPEAQEAADSMNVSQRCAAVGCTYNETDNLQTTSDCRNNISAEAVDCGSIYEIPLSGLLSGSGMIFIIIMAALLIIIVRSFIKGKQ